MRSIRGFLVLQMILLYNLFITLYSFVIRIAAIFSPKAKLWIEGRKGVFAYLQAKINPNKNTVWIHAASLGEFEQGRPLIEKIRSQYPDNQIVLTFFSPSGYEIRKHYPLVDVIVYLPIDTPKNVNLFLDIVKPNLIIFIKYEFWYHYLSEATKRQIPTIYIAALFWESLSYFKWYFSFFIPIFQKINHFFVQNQNSKQVLEEFVFKNNPNPPISVVGDPRIDRVVEIASQSKSYDTITKFIGDTPKENVIIAGSTWDADEKILKPFFEQNRQLKIILAPHEIGATHLASIEKLFGKQCCVRYSEASKFEDSIATFQILIIDNIGMLSSLYRYGSVAYIGGGFGAGIHNTLEPMAYKLPIIFGHKYTKFEEANAMVAQRGAVSVSTAEALQTAFTNFIQKENYIAAQNKIQLYLSKNQGATDRIFNYIEPYLISKSQTK